MLTCSTNWRIRTSRSPSLHRGDMILCSLGGMKGNLFSRKDRPLACLAACPHVYEVTAINLCLPILAESFWYWEQSLKLEAYLSDPFSMVLCLMTYICVSWSRRIRSIRGYKSKFHIENTLQRLCDHIEIGIPRRRWSSSRCSVRQRGPKARHPPGTIWSVKVPSRWALTAMILWYSMILTVFPSAAGA